MTIASWWCRAIAVVAALAVASTCAVAKPLPGQDGLPPELVIEDNPSLEVQARLLRSCIEWARQNQPRGGFLEGLKGLFSRKPTVLQVNVSDLSQHPGQFAGQLVAVHGLYEKISEQRGLFSSGTTELCYIAVPQSVRPVGFPDGSAEGLPTKVEGFVESEGGVPVIHATSIQPSGLLAVIRLGRVQELQAQRLEELSAAIAAEAGLQPGDIEVGIWRASGRYVVRVKALATRDGDKIRAVAGKALGLEPKQVELVDLEISRETQPSIITSVDKYQEAASTYAQIGGQLGSGHLYAFIPFASTHGALLEMQKLADRGGRKRAAKQLSRAWTPLTARDRRGKPLYYTWLQQADGKWQKVAVRDAIAKPLDSMNRQSIWYKLVELFVLLGGGNAAMGMILLAVISRVAIYPLTKKQLESAEKMKRLQPQIKKLQEQYKSDKQKFQEEFWKLCQANKVNPLGGCMPLLVQMPILILIYQGIRQYIVQFDKASFLWVHNLAQPDLILLLCYTASMVLFQQMTNKTNPTASMDPQQAQQQRMMTWMMPLMFFFFFRGLPAAFILYWLGTNVVYFLQQWLYMRQAAAHGEAVPVGAQASGSGAGGGFSGWMAKLMSSGQGEEGQPRSTQSKPSGQLSSYEEKKRAEAGKKLGREDEPKSKRRRGRR